MSKLTEDQRYALDRLLGDELYWRKRSARLYDLWLERGKHDQQTPEAKAQLGFASKEHDKARNAYRKLYDKLCRPPVQHTVTPQVP